MMLFAFMSLITVSLLSFLATFILVWMMITLSRRPRDYAIPGTVTLTLLSRYHRQALNAASAIGVVTTTANPNGAVCVHTTTHEKTNHACALFSAQTTNGH